MSGYHIPEPCHESWDAMSPAERGRHCARCDKVVVDLTACTGGEARRILDQARPQADGSLGICARVRVDARRRLVLGRFRRHVLTSGMALLLAGGALSGCDAPIQGKLVAGTVAVEPPPEDPPELQGDVAIMGELVAPEPAPPQPEEPALQGRVAVQPELPTIMGGLQAPPSADAP